MSTAFKYRLTKERVRKTEKWHEGYATKEGKGSIDSSSTCRAKPTIERARTRVVGIKTEQSDRTTNDADTGGEAKKNAQSITANCRGI